MNFTFVNSTVRSSLWINILRKSIKIRTPSLPGSGIVGETFLRVYGGHYIERFEEFTGINVKVDFCQKY